jgi:SnoaL-like domain
MRTVESTNEIEVRIMSADELHSLALQLKEHSDRRAITELITRLGRMLDGRNYDQASSILAADVTVQTPGGASEGPEAVVAQARRNHTVRTQHLITDVLIELDGDDAQATANLVVVFVPDSDQPDARLTIGDSEPAESRLTIGERYRFEARRGAQGWRLRRVEVARVWSSRPIPRGARVQEAQRNAG